jgi:hypothetical protein
MMTASGRIDLEKTGAYLRAVLLRLMPQPGCMETGINGFQLVRMNCPTEVQMCFYAPKIIVQLQGTKHVLIGSEEFIYKQNSYTPFF